MTGGGTWCESAPTWTQRRTGVSSQTSWCCCPLQFAGGVDVMYVFLQISCSAVGLSGHSEPSRVSLQTGENIEFKFILRQRKMQADLRLYLVDIIFKYNILQLAEKHCFHRVNCCNSHCRWSSRSRGWPGGRSRRRRSTRQLLAEWRSCGWRSNICIGE